MTTWLPLVEVTDNGLHLTPDGHQRYSRLPRATSLAAAPTYDELMSALAERLRKERGQSETER